MSTKKQVFGPNSDTSTQTIWTNIFKWFRPQVSKTNLQNVAKKDLKRLQTANFDSYWFIFKV